MTLTNLIKTLAAEIGGWVSESKFAVEYFDEAARRTQTTWRVPKVFTQQIPADLFESEVYYPCVVVEFLECVDDLKAGSIAKVGLTVGTYAKESDGWQDALRLAEILRVNLLSKQLLGSCYRLVEGLTWQPVTNQPTPFFFVYGEAAYRLPMPREGIT